MLVAESYGLVLFCPGVRDTNTPIGGRGLPAKAKAAQARGRARIAAVAVCFIYFFRRQQRVDKGQFSSLISVKRGCNPSSSLSEISLHPHSKHGSRVLPMSYDVVNEP